jgi:hypothetical protein
LEVLGPALPVMDSASAPELGLALDVLGSAVPVMDSASARGLGLALQVLGSALEVLGLAEGLWRRSACPGARRPQQQVQNLHAAHLHSEEEVTPP